MITPTIFFFQNYSKTVYYLISEITFLFGKHQVLLIDKTTPGRRQSKTPILSRNVDQTLLETEFLIAICHHTGDKWQSKTLFLSIFDARSSIVDGIFDCRLSGVKTKAEIYGEPYQVHVVSIVIMNKTNARNRFY